MPNKEDNNNTLVIIGGDAAGMSAAAKVRRRQPDRKIIVFEKTAYTSYSACGIPYFIAGKVTDCDELIQRTPQEFKSEYNIDVYTNHLVKEVDVNNKKIKVENREHDKIFWQEYDELLIATGGKAFCPDVEGNDAENVFGISTLRSGIRVEKYLKDYKPKNAVIIGGGYIGLEMAEALLTRGLKVSIVTRGSQLMDTLDPDMGEKISEAMRCLGIEIYLNEEFKNFKLKDDKVTAVVTTNKTVDADIVILGMGSAPNTAFLENSGIELGIKNAIKVNSLMQTNVNNIWAAGDCTETLHLVSKKQVYIALGTVANKTGLVAGSNLAGDKIIFPGAVGTAVCKVCKYEVARTGLQEKELKDAGIEYVTAVIDSATRANYYPGAKEITVKLLAEKNSGRILGGQIIGEEGAAKRIDVLAVAVTHGITVKNLIDMDLSYAPPFSPVWDPVQTAARVLIKKI